MNNLPVVSLYNTRSRSIEPLAPIEPGKVRLYCCGPTVYSYQHLGNLRTYIFEDLLVRTLRECGYKTVHVMNITDVGHLVGDGDDGEDKMLAAARREKKRSEEIASYYTDVFFRDCEALNIRRPDIVCKATEHIPQMITMIEELERRGHAYRAGGNVYFDITSFPRYGDFARLPLQQLEAGARIAVDANKRHPLDFALWFTKSKFENQELVWESPFGKGYPGWHIECSAMACHYLGAEFDIHCGGIDHVPVHHTNEIAQSECASGKTFARHWLHGEFLVLHEKKMSKSAGGTLTVSTLRQEGIDPLAYRYFCLGAHYRTQLTFSMDALRSSESGFHRLRRGFFPLLNVEPKQDLSDQAIQLLGLFRNAMRADLNAPQALAALHEIASSGLAPEEKRTLIERIDGVLGLSLLEPLSEEKVVVSSELQSLLDERSAARNAKDWAKSDLLRTKIQELGFDVKDGPGSRQELRKMS